ncbi:MAG: hypothetical protein R2844_02830 [Caldilineales bacterium]
MDEQGTTPEADQEAPTNAAAERMRQARELAQMTVAGAVSTINSMAEMSAAEATANSLTAAGATQELSGALGKAAAGVVQGASVSTGAIVGGAKGALGGLIMAAQISGGALMEATRGLAGATARTAGAVTEGLVIATQDQEQGADQVRQAAKAFTQESFDATAGAAFGALGGAATATGALAGGVKGALGGTVEGLKLAANAGADATYVVAKETARGSTEVARRVLRRPEEE